MLNAALKDFVTGRILPNIQTPAQYIGGELNSVVKDHRDGRGDGLPGLPRHLRPGDEPPRAPGALQPDERPTAGPASGPSRRCPTSRRPSASTSCPLYSLETFTPLARFDVVGFSLQYEICYTNVLTMLDLGGIPLHAEDRGPDDTLVIAGGPGAQNPELLAPYIDLFVIGDGEPSLPVVCELWKAMQGDPALTARGQARADRRRRSNWAYVPRFYEPEYHADGTIADIVRTARRRPRGDQALRDRRPRRHPAADPADRPVRRDGPRPDRHRDHARLPLAVPLLPEHGDQAAAALPDGRDDRRAPRWRATGTPATTRSACSRSRPATTPTSRSWSRG